MAKEFVVPTFAKGDPEPTTAEWKGKCTWPQFGRIMDAWAKAQEEPKATAPKTWTKYSDLPRKVRKCKTPADALAMIDTAIARWTAQRAVVAGLTPDQWVAAQTAGTDGGDEGDEGAE